MTINHIKSFIPGVCLAALFLLQSCADSTEVTTNSNGEKSETVSGSSKRFEGATVSNEMAHWIGTYRFTDSPMTSSLEFYKITSSSNAIANRIMPTYPEMKLIIFEKNSKLVGQLLLTNVQEERNVSVVINGTPSSIGVYFASSNNLNKGFEEKGELLLSLREDNGVLTTTWKSWYPLNEHESITSGFIKDAVK